MAASSAAYAGDLSPKEAWELLGREKDAALIDCRTAPEWSFVGIPDLSTLGKRPLLVAWQEYTGAGMAPNPAFVEQVKRAGVAPDAPVVIICRSGARSRSAAIALTQAGYKTCFNLSGGFEGPHDATQHRGAVAGWKASNLPWMQE
jgi:rhodanese-related sulfurtransferase